MSTFEKLNQRGVVIICIIIHCSNGFRESLVLKLCYKIRPVLFSARLIEDQFDICVTIYDMSTCLPLQSFPAVLCIAHSTKQPSAVNKDSQHNRDTEVQYDCTYNTYPQHDVCHQVCDAIVRVHRPDSGGIFVGISSACVCGRMSGGVRE